MIRDRIFLVPVDHSNKVGLVLGPFHPDDNLDNPIDWLLSQSSTLIVYEVPDAESVDHAVDQVISSQTLTMRPVTR